MNKSTKIALFQLTLVALYFPFYYGSIWLGLIYTGFYLVFDLKSWSKAIAIHSNDEKFIFFIITVVTSFTAVIFFFANIYELIGTIAITGTNTYITGLWEHVYFSVTTFTTLGYGEYTPQSYAKIATSIQAIFGLGYFAFIVGVSGTIYYSRIKNT